MILLRLIHILTGIVWVGGMTFFMFFLLPGLQGEPAVMGKVMQGLARRNYMLLMPLIAIATILSGLAMIWVTSGGHVGLYMQTRSGHTFTMAGGLAILGFLVGMFLSRPAGMKAAAIGAQMATATDPAEQARLKDQMAGLQKKSGVYSILVMVLLLAAAAGMAIARYV